MAEAKRESVLRRYRGNRVMPGMVLACILINCLSVASAHGVVRTPSVIGNNMVLQRAVRVPIWGTASPGEHVTVTMANAHVSTTADASGHWKVMMGPWQAGGPFTMTIAGENTITLENVLVGEVWLCSGQSNMAMAMDPDLPIGAGGILNARQELATADYPSIRLFEVKRVSTGTPQTDTTASWKTTTPQTVATFSAVGYLFARELYQRLHVPIGIIESAWGGTAAQSWISRQALESNPKFQHIVVNSDKKIKDYDSLLKDYKQQLEIWQPTADAAEATGGPVPAPPQSPADLRSSPHRSSGLYNGMIAPLVPYYIHGVVWYQGEADTTGPELYRALFPALIEDWRRTWGEGNFPFIYVQLPNFDTQIERAWGFWKPDAPPMLWPELREAQLEALSLPQTAMAVAIDVGDPKNIHPKNKQVVAHRLVLAALHSAYGKDEPYSGPIYRSMKKKGARIRLSFDHVEGGLISKGSVLHGFEIAGEDQNYRAANAQIVGSSVIVSSPAVPDPTTVRYGWVDNPDCNLYNSFQLPASPFRTNAPDDGNPKYVHN